MLTEDKREKMGRRVRDMDAEANIWNTRWKDIATYVCPGRGMFDDDNPNEAKAHNSQTVIDVTPALALRTLAAIFSSGLTPSSRPWMRLGLQDKELQAYRPVKLWLSDVETKMYSVFAASNFYKALNTNYLDLCGFGTSNVIIEEDYNNVIKCQAFTAGEFTLSDDAMGRKFWMRVWKLVDEFGIENVSDSVKEQYTSGKLEMWVKCRHLIEKNDNRIPGIKAASGKEYRSVYWEEGKLAEKTLREGGFEERPYMTPRWEVKNTSATYGLSPGWLALGDVKMLQKLHTKKLWGLDKQLDPPLQHDATMDIDNILVPGETVPYSGDSQTGGAKPIYEVNFDLNAVRQEIMEVQNRIDRAFFRDLILMTTQPTMPQKTAREIVEKHEEKFMVVNPALESITSEQLDPGIDRVFGIMLRSGMLPRPPEELRGSKMKVEYISLLAQAQKMIGTSNVEQFTGFVISSAQAFPTVLDKVDSDKMVDDYGDKMAIPPELLRDQEVVDEIRKQRAEAEQQAQSAQIAGQAVAGAKALSETEMNKGSALDTLVGSLPGAAGAA